MFRAIFELLITVVVLWVVRSVIGIVLRGFSEAMKPGSGTAPPGASRPAGPVPITGELKKDPVCGTYISTATSVKEKVGGETLHFCSNQCRDKYVATLAR
jgi:YHS domain-containing protein